MDLREGLNIKFGSWIIYISLLTSLYWSHICKQINRKTAKANLFFCGYKKTISSISSRAAGCRPLSQSGTKSERTHINHQCEKNIVQILFLCFFLSSHL